MHPGAKVVAKASEEIVNHVDAKTTCGEVCKARGDSGIGRNLHAAYKQEEGNGHHRHVGSVVCPK